MRYLIVAPALLVLVAAAEEHQNATSANNSTAGNDHVGWVSSPPTRSTMDIIWACFSVLLVCTYKCVHLDLPTAEENNAGWHKVHGVSCWPRRPRLRKFLRQLKYMGLILIAPEIGVGLAWYEFVEAKESVKKCNSKNGLTITHGFFANMGGFVAVYIPNSEAADPTEVLETQHNEDEGLRVRRLTLEEYVEVLESLGNYEGCLASENSIHDRSKSDIFTKGFAIIQSIWLVTQCISRAAVGLPITELELATVAYVLCAILMYTIWWSKPFGAEEPIHVPVREGSRFYTLSRQQPKNYKNIVNILDGEEDNAMSTVCTILATATIFSGIHLVAWNWDFPSPLCANLWRAFSTGATAYGPLMLLNWSWLGSPEICLGIYLEWLSLMFSYTGLLIYVLSRIGLLVLVFYSFTSMRVEIYTTIEWSSYLPHIG